MFERLPFVPPYVYSAACPRCEQSTFHIRGRCRTCDPCTTTLLVARAEAALFVVENPDESSAERELAA